MTRLKNWQLFAICVLTWGTTWHAITYQLGHTTPEFGVAIRFALAGASVLLLCLWRGDSLRCRLPDHAALALQGGFMYALSYFCVYRAELHLPSGVVAIGYSASPLISGLGALLLFGTLVSGRFIVGGVMGLAGVTLLFWPEIGKAAAGPGNGKDVLLGAMLTISAVVLSSVGSLTASRNRGRGLAFWPALGWGLFYGGTISFAVVLALGQPLGLPTAPSWWLSLLYLAWAGSVLTFACFLTLMERVGPGPAGAVGVMTPLLALGVSVALEGFQPSGLTFAGVALAVLGNVLMLRQATKPRRPPTPEAPPRAT